MFLSRLIVALVSAAVLTPVSQAASPAKPRIVALGDSLTSGQGIGASRAYPALLQQRIDEAGLVYAVVNAGVAGDTSDRALGRFERALDGDVRILIVALGANDGLRGVPVARLKENLSRIVETAQARNITVLLCAMEALPIHGWDYTVAFHNVYRDLAAQYNVPLVPFILFNVIGHRDLMQPDGAHPNAAGRRAIAETIWPFLEPLVTSTVAGAGL